MYGFKFGKRRYNISPFYASIINKKSSMFRARRNQSKSFYHDYPFRFNVRYMDSNSVAYTPGGLWCFKGATLPGDLHPRTRSFSYKGFNPKLGHYRPFKGYRENLE